MHGWTWPLVRTCVLLLQIRTCPGRGYISHGYISLSSSFRAGGSVWRLAVSILNEALSYDFAFRGRHRFAGRLWARAGLGSLALGISSPSPVVGAGSAFARLLLPRGSVGLTCMLLNFFFVVFLFGMAYLFFKAAIPSALVRPRGLVGFC